ncbi:ABC transporter ATP-binding protein [Infirmifilum sp. SLHALR2]|nr:MAG: dipeptide/oligopeptide/nickel ABC transporter ATP-binding protein [Thermofilum sp. NZ13]
MPLEVKNLTMHYEVDGGGYVKAVDGVSFSLSEGESLGIVGESGCGKSSLATTLVRVLPSNAKIKAGEVVLDGVNILSLPEERLRREIRWKKISVVFQGSMNALNPVLKVGDQIAEAILLHEDVSKDQAMARIRKLLGLVGLDPSVANRYPFELSGGQRQRALIAMALALNPKVVIADEPTTALDVIVQAQILKLLGELRESSKSMMIFISHDVSAVAQVSDKVAVMYAGKIVEIGPAEKVLLEPLHPYTSALLQSVPSVKGERRQLKPIPGSPPNLLNPPRGCRFHPRCPFATDKCRSEEPQLREVSPGHFVACHLYG